VQFKGNINQNSISANNSVKQLEQKEYIYTSESELKRIPSLLRSMLKDLNSSYQLAYILVSRDIKAQYRQSMLGIIWAFVPAIITAITFTVASNQNIINITTPDIPYPAYIIFSMTLWQTFSASLTAPMHGLNGASDILSKIKFPREAIIVAKFGDVIFNFLIKLILIIIVFVWYGLPIHIMTVLAPLAVLNLIIFGFGMGMILAPLNALYHDIGRAVGIVLGFGIFLTPVVFPMPEGNGIFAMIVQYNPVTHLLVGVRELTLYGKLVDNSIYILVTFLNLILFFFSWLFFRLSIPFIIERSS
jgi:lipopolysaccharide transport system permease protein